MRRAIMLSLALVLSSVTTASASYWHIARTLPWYGPGFYGNRTACGLKMTRTLVGVASRTLPCGTKVRFKYGGKTITVPVVDRGPYPSRDRYAEMPFDLTAGASIRLLHEGQPKPFTRHNVKYHIFYR